MAAAKKPLSAATRKAMPKTAFAVPSKRAYPVPDANHARMALAMVAKNGTPAQKKQVRAAVKKKFPAIKQAK